MGLEPKTDRLRVRRATQCAKLCAMNYLQSLYNSGNPRRHITALQKLKDRVNQGEPSLQNSLELAMQTLRHMPSHASREVLAIFGSLTTCDPGDILQTVKVGGSCLNYTYNIGVFYVRNCHIRGSLVFLSSHLCLYIILSRLCFR